MKKKEFRNLMADLERRVHEEGKKNPSWLMGYLQGLGTRSLTGFQCAALVDLLLVPLERKKPGVDAAAGTYKNDELSEPEPVPEQKKESEASPEPKAKPEVKASNNLLKTLAQR